LHIMQELWARYRPPGVVYLETAGEKTAGSVDGSGCIDIVCTKRLPGLINSTAFAGP